VAATVAVIAAATSGRISRVIETQRAEVIVVFLEL
jgi:hypothetical protein